MPRTIQMTSSQVKRIVMTERTVKDGETGEEYAEMEIRLDGDAINAGGNITFPLSLRYDASKLGAEALSVLEQVRTWASKEMNKAAINENIDTKPELGL